MTDIHEHNPGDHEDPTPGSTWLVGIVFTVIFAIIVLALTALTYNVDREEIQRKVVDVEPLERQQLRVAQEEKLHGEPRWVEQIENDQVVRALVIPIDQAMDLVVQEMGPEGGAP